VKALATLILLVGTATFAFGQPTPVPEIDANTSIAAITLVSGALVVFRGRRRK